MERSTHGHPQSCPYSRGPTWLRQMKIQGTWAQSDRQESTRRLRFLSRLWYDPQASDLAQGARHDGCPTLACFDSALCSVQHVPAPCSRPTTAGPGHATDG